MLPGNLVSIYKEYKEDTNSVASWLASTAKSCGYPADLLCGGSSQATDPKPSKRLKGKARKEAKAAAPQSQGSSSNSSCPDYIIAIKDFIPLAMFVAASKKPVVSVPLAFANTLNRVIATRSRFGSRLAVHGNSTDASADSKHSYFVGVLEKVREVLKPRIPPVSQDAASPRSPSDPVGEVGGRFAGLNVYEPTEELLNAPDIERPESVKKDTVTYVAELLQDLEEAMFAYTLLMNDLAKIRDRIEWIWTNYREGCLELVAAAIATNTACDLARDLMEDMAPMFKAHGGAKNIANFFYVTQSMLQGFPFNEIVNTGNDFNCDTYDIANDTYMIAFMTLNSCLEAMGPPDVLFVYKEGMFGSYDPTLDWDEMSKQEKMDQDKILMAEILTELMTVVRCVPTYPVCDELIRGVQEFNQTQEIPFYLAFAAQIVLDIHHILRGRICSAHEMCMSHLGLLDEDIALYMEFHSNFPTKNWTASEIQSLEGLRMNIKWIQDDPVHKAKVKVSGRSDIPCTAPIHRILKHSPVISGLILYHFRARTYNLGLKLADSWGSIVFPLHLYTALRRQTLLSPQQVPEESWEDMVVVTANLGNDSFYVGSQLPKNPEDYMKSLALQMGTTAALFSKNKNKRTLSAEKLRSKSGPRGIKKNCAPVTDMFIDRYVRNTGQVDWTAEHVDRVVSRSLWERQWSEEDGKFFLAQIDDPERLRERKRSNTAQAAGRKPTVAASTRMPPEQLIRDLIFALQAESLTLAFPYLTVQRAAWGVLRAVHQACEPLLLDRFGRVPLDDESQLPWVVSQIFMALALGDEKPLVKAGEAVKDKLRRGEGVKAIERLESMGYKVLRKEGETTTAPPWGTYSVISCAKRT